MSISKESIVNSALIKLGASTISSLTEDTKNALVMRELFGTAFLATLRAHPWNFAKKRVKIYPTATPPAFGYDNAFDLPNDWVKTLNVDTYGQDDVEFHTENNQILCNFGTLDLLYIYRNEDPSSWDPCFAEALAWRLARDAAFTITQSTEREEKCDTRFKEQLREARTMNGTENTLQALLPNTFTEARR